MQIADQLLIKMIEKDLLDAGISNYHMEDKTFENPTLIKVGANEIVYTVFWGGRSAVPFNVKMTSGSSLTTYSNLNTTSNSLIDFLIDGTVPYQSSVIARHLNSISFVKSDPSINFFIRCVRLSFSLSPQNENT